MTKLKYIIGLLAIVPIIALTQLFIKSELNILVNLLLGVIILAIYFPFISEIRIKFRVKKKHSLLSRIPIRFFIPILIILFFTTLFFVAPLDEPLYIKPLRIGFPNWIRLSAAVVITTFLPGVFVILSLIRRPIDLFLLLVLSYIMSISFSSFISYIIVVAGGNLQNHGMLSVVCLTTILAMIYLLLGRKNSTIYLKEFVLAEKIALFAMFIFVMLSSYGLYGTALISDQRFHHGYALLRGKSLVEIGGTLEPSYPWPFHMYLALLFSISGIPSLNTYNFLNFLNFLPILSYYLLIRSFIDRKYHPAIIMSTLFAFFSSGFGWIYFLYQFFFNIKSFYESVFLAWGKTFDLLTPNSILLSGHPSITSPLILFILPSMFLILYILQQNESRKLGVLKYPIICWIFFFMYMSHFESLIILGYIWFVILLQKEKKLGITVFLALVAVLIVDWSSPGKLYSTLELSVFGQQFPILYLTIGVTIVITLMSCFIPNLSKAFCAITRLRENKRLFIIIVFAFIYIYLFSLIVWSMIINEFDIYMVWGSGEIPWYFAPIRMGVVGLLGSIGLIYILFTHGIQEKSLSPVMLWILVISLVLPIYPEEHFRLQKYLQFGFSIFAGVMLNILFLKMIKISKGRYNFKRFLGVTIVLGLVMAAALGSPLIYIEYNAHASTTKDPKNEVLWGLSIPDKMELEALSWLKEKLDPVEEGVITLPTRYIWNTRPEVVMFAGARFSLTNLFLPLFEIKYAENFYDIAQRSQLKYIYMTDDDLMFLNSHPKYKFSFLSELLSYLPVVYNNSMVTIFELPPVTPPTKSDVAVIIPGILDAGKGRTFIDQLPITLAAMSNLCYSIVAEDDSSIYNYKTIIIDLISFNNLQNELIKWTKKGGRLIVLDFPEQHLLNTTFEYELKDYFNINETNLRTQISEPFKLKSSMGKGEIISLKFYPLSLEIQTEKSKRELFARTIKLFKMRVNDLPFLESNVWTENNIYSLNYATGPIEMNGILTVNSDFFYIKNSTSSFTLQYLQNEDYQHTENSTLLNPDEIIVIKYFEVYGLASFLFTTDHMLITPSNFGAYAEIETNSSFEFFILLNNLTEAKVVLEDGNESMLLSGGTMHIRKIHENCESSINDYDLKAIVKAPLIQATGTVLFNKAYFKQDNFYTNIAWDVETKVIGSMNFTVAYTDQVIRIENLTVYEGVILSEKHPYQIKTWDDWSDVPWVDVLTSPHNILLLLVVITLMIIFMRKNMI